MTYDKSDWKSGDIISSSKLNNIETGIYDSVIDNQNGTITVNGDIIDVQSLLNINLDDYYTKEQVDQELPLKPGPKGTSITGISQTYQLSDSETISPTGTWTTAIQTPTDELPYLWVQNIFLTNDGSNIILTYVCPIGKTGATGPQGETGQGIDIKGYYESSSSLPTTGNNGDCYIIDYDLYVYMNGSYTDVGQLTADSSTFVDVTTLNAGLATKVTDNKDGTEQLNGVQVQPFNKLSDTIGGRNLLLGTSSTEVINSAWDNKFYVDVTKLTGATLTYSCILDITQANQGNVSASLCAQDSSGNTIGSIVPSNPIAFGNSGKVIITITVPSGASRLCISERTNNTNVNPTVSCRMLETGTIPTDWTPAPEDKANDSEVAHLSGANNFDTVPTYGANKIPLALNNSGSTANRPTGQVVGYQYFDTTLNKPIWYNGSSWVDSTGTTV